MPAQPRRVAAAALLFLLGCALVAALAVFMNRDRDKYTCHLRAAPREAFVDGRFDELSQAITALRQDIGRWPRTLEELQDCPLGSEKTWRGPYVATLDHSLLDPWGNPYRLEVDEESVLLISWGSDGRPDGAPDFYRLVVPDLR